MNDLALAVVDDDEAMRALIADMLSRHAPEIATFATGADWLQALQPGRYAQLILDLSLPDMDGFDLLGRMAEQGCILPLLLISGHAQSTVQAAMLYARGLGFTQARMLCKPFSRTDLLLALGLPQTSVVAA